jgi:nuclear pore complex protein Nup155
VWKQILDEETSGATTKEKWNFILSKVKNLAYEYGNSSHCFPIPFIVRELERKCLRMHIQGNPVPKALVEMNIDVDILLEVYARYFFF